MSDTQDIPSSASQGLAAHCDMVPSSSSGSEKSKVFPLFKLPDELVIRILEFSVVTSSKEDPIQVERSNAKAVAQPALIRTCRFMRHEGLKVFYSGNVFCGTTGYKETETFRRWIDAIGADNVRTIRQVQMVYGSGIGEPRSVTEWDWDDWMDEIINLAGADDEVGVCKGHTLYIHTRSEKVVIGPGLAYCLSFRDESQNPSDWTSAAALVKTIHEMPHEKFYDTDTIVSADCVTLPDQSEEQ